MPWTIGHGLLSGRPQVRVLPGAQRKVLVDVVQAWVDRIRTAAGAAVGERRGRWPADDQAGASFHRFPPFVVAEILTLAR
jgi:hypothetical protein